MWQWVARGNHPTRFPRMNSIWSSGSCCSYLSGDCKLLFAKFVHIYVLSCPVGYAWLPLMDSNGRYLHTKLLLASSTVKIYFKYSCMRPHSQVNMGMRLTFASMYIYKYVSLSSTECRVCSGSQNLSVAATLPPGYLGHSVQPTSPGGKGVRTAKIKLISKYCTLNLRRVGKIPH